MRPSFQITGFRKSVAVLLLLGFVIGSAPGLTAFAEEEVKVPAYSGREPKEHPILAPCSRFEDRYQHLGFTETQIDEWPDIYHNRVDRIVEEYLKPVELSCAAENYVAFMKPGGELTDLAASLPTWNDPKVPLSRFDTSRVLLEYLRIYECALTEFDHFRSYGTAKEEFREEFGPGDVTAFFDFFFSDLMVNTKERGDIINRERIVARKSLQRVLTLMGAFDRLRPLDGELECMQRFSIDVRNISALSAETSACLPRVWNAKDVLRDYPEKDE